MKHFRIVQLALFFTFVFTGCQTDEAPVVYKEGTNEYVNQWMYDQMKIYYYWNDEMNKADLSLEPKEYFSQLLYQEDRFSYAYHPTQPESVPQSIRSRFGFDMGFRLFEGQVYGVVLYTLAGSPAESYGLVRGQLIIAINNTQFTQSNYESLYHSLENTANADLTIVGYDSETGFSEPQMISLTSFFTFSQPIVTTIFETGGKKIGYLEIAHFDVGLAQQFVQAFQEFKNQSCNEIILDLRYNGGGDVSSATALCILLAQNGSADDFFIRFKGNENGGVIDQSFREALEMNETNISYEALSVLRLNTSKVYILCGSHTASASEIVINNLKPFTEVITIGEKTVGKDMAGFVIVDDRNMGEQGWNLYPCIYKLFNADNESGYNTGIAPLYEMDELTELDIFPLGDDREFLIKKAIDLITGELGREQVANKTKILTLPKPYFIANINPVILPQNIFN